MIEDGLFNLMKGNATVQDFWGKDNNGNNEFQFFFLGVFDPVETPPYAVLARHKRTPDIDLQAFPRQKHSIYTIETYHNDSWALINLQEAVLAILESLSLTTLGGIYIQKLVVTDDYYELPPEHLEAKIRLWKGVLEFEIVHNPN